MIYTDCSVMFHIYNTECGGLTHEQNCIIFNFISRFDKIVTGIKGLHLIPFINSIEQTKFFTYKWLGMAGLKLALDLFSGKFFLLFLSYELAHEYHGFGRTETYSKEIFDSIRFICISV